MRRPVLAGALAAGAALLLAAGIAVAALLMDDDDNEPSGATTGPVVATTGPPPAPSVVATAVPSREMPPEINSLPAAIRDRIRDQYLRGEITRVQIQQLVQQRSAAARSGIITRIESGKIDVRTYDGEDYTWTITPATAIRHINKPATPADLKVGETVFIISRDGGQTAFSIESYGTLASP